MTRSVKHLSLFVVLSVLTFFFSPPLAYADWALNNGGDASQIAMLEATAVDGSGNVYIAGRFNGATFTLGSVTLTRVGTIDAFAAKIDPSGTVLWARNFGGSGASAYGQGIAVDASGNVYLGGYFANADLTVPSLIRTGTNDAFAIKLDSSGNTTWAKNFGGSGATVNGQGIAVDSSGNVYLGGDFSGASLTAPSLTKIGNKDAFAIKLDSAGNTAWAKNFGGSGANAMGLGIDVDASGNVHLGGNFIGENLTTPALTKIGSQDAFVIKLDSSGSTAWAKNYGGSGASSTGRSIAVDGSGNVYLGGDFSGASLTTPALTKIGNRDAIAIKIDSTGTTIWSRNYGGNLAYTNGYSISVDGSGNVYLGGYFYNAPSLTAPPITMIGNQTAFAIKIDSSGDAKWTRTFGGSGASVYGNAVTVDGSGNIYLGGYFYGADLTSPTLSLNGSYDLFIVKSDMIVQNNWAVNNGGDAAQTAVINSTAVDGSGNVYVAGYFNGTTITLGSFNLTRIGNQDAFAAKLDSSGTVLWAKNFGGSGAGTWGQGIIVDGSGNVYVCGRFTSADLTTPVLTKTGNMDAFAIKLDSDGNTTWARNYGGSGASVYGQGIAVDASGNVYLGGDFEGSSLTTPSLTKIGSKDVFAIKLDSNGNTTWSRNYGGSGANAKGNSIAVDKFGNVYLGGYFGGANLTTPALTKKGTQDAIAIKLDSDGNTTWSKNYGGSGASVVGNGIAVDGLGNVYLGGYFGGASLTTPALTKIGTYDAFAIKLNSPGTTTWARNFGGSGASAYGNGIAVDSQGNVYLGGSFSYASLTTPALTKIGGVTGQNDLLAIRMDSAGTTTWAQNYSGYGATGSISGIAVDGTGNIYMGGGFSWGDLTAPPLTKNGGGDAFVMKISDMIHPDTTITGSPAIYANSTTAVFTFAATETGTFQCSLDGGTFAVCNSPVNYAGLLDGVHTFDVKAVDAGWNIDQTPSNYVWAVDTVIPETTITGGTGNPTNSTSGVFTFSASESATFQCKLDGGGYTPCSSPATYSDLAEGSHTFYVKAIDGAGNTDASPAAYTWTVDLSVLPDWGVNNTGEPMKSARVNATAADGFGNVYVTGFFNATTFTMGSVTLTRIGTQDAFAAKLDAAGGVLWAKNYGGSGASASGQSIAVDVSGNVYLGGYFSGASLTTPPLTKKGNQDAYAIKLDSNGNTTWAKNYGGTSGAVVFCLGIAADSSGNVYLGGYFGGANLTTPALTKKGTQDAFAVKLDSSGNTTWSRNYGGTGASAAGSGIAVDASGNVYLGGYFGGANLTTPALTKKGTQDAFVVKINSAGTTIWSRNYGGGGASVNGKDIALDGSGNVYLGGYFSGANMAVPGLTKIGNSDLFAIKLDSSGNTTWSRNYGGSGASVYGNGIAVDGSGNVYLGGYFSGADLTPLALVKRGNNDVLAIKLDSSGTSTWSRNYGGSGANAFDNGIDVDSSGNVYLGGYFSNANLDVPSLVLNGTQDAFIMKVSDTILPDTSIDSNPPSLANVTSASFTFSATEAATFQCDIDGAGYTSCSSPANYTGLAEGGHIFYVKAVDSSGNVDGTPTGYSWMIDLTAPETFITGGPGSITGSTSAVILFSASETATFQCRLDAGSYTACISPVAYSDLAAGSHTIYVKANDGAGNTDASPAAYSWTVDLSAPTDWGVNNTGEPMKSARVNATAADNFGNVYVAGFFNATTFTFGGTTLTRLGTQDAFAAKLNETGTVLWAKNFGGSGAMTYGNGIAVDSSGNVYLGGRFRSADLTTPSLTKIGVDDAFAIKLDSSGNIVWSRNYGGSSANASGEDIAVDIYGNVYLCGYFTSSSLTTPILSKMGTLDAFAIKLDSSGNTIWSRNYYGGAAASATATGIAVDDSGNVYLGGYFSGANLTTPALTKKGNQDAFAIKIDSAGATVWSRNYGGTGASVYGKNISLDGSGNVYMVGYFSGANMTAPVLTKIGTFDLFTIKLDWSGNTTWSRNYGGSGASAYGNDIAVDDSGNVYLGGSFSIANLTNPALTKTGNGDAVAIKLDSNGVATWFRNYGGSGASAYVNGIALDVSGNVYLGGYFTGADLDTPYLVLHGTQDAFIMKVSDTTFPDTAITGSPASYTNSTSAEFAFSATETATFQCELDGGGYSPCTSPESYTGLAEGIHSFFVKAIDPAGNADTTPASYSWTVDLTVPNTFIAGSPTNPARSSTAVFSFSASESATFQCRLDEGGYTSCTSPATYVALAEGSHSFYVKAADIAGNIDATPAIYIWTVDYSASVSTDWSINNGGAAAQDARTTATAADGSGNVYIAGYFTGATFTLGGVTLTRIGTGDAFAAKIDPSGAVIWAKNYGGAGATTEGSGIAVDGSGNVYLGGYFHSANLTYPALTNIGSIDAFAIKLTPSGATAWARNYGGVGANAIGSSIAVDGSGNVYLGGWFSGASLTTLSFTKIGTDDAFVVKLNSSGAPTWARNFGGSGASVYGYSVAVDSSGNSYLGGYFSSANLTIPALTKVGTTDAFVIKLNSSGFTTWARNYGGGSAQTHGTSVAVDGSENVYLGGYFNSANLSTPLLARAGSQDAFALKIGSSGDTTWARNFGGSGATTYGRGIAVDGSGNVYLGGYFSGANLTMPAMTKKGTYDAFAIKIDSAGTSTWAKNYGGNGASAYGFGIAADGSGTVYLGGYFSGANLTMPALTKNGTYDAYILRADTVSPDTTVTASPADPSNSSSAFFSFTSTETVAFQCSLDGATYTACTSPASYTSLSDGSHTFYVKAIDGAGNIDATPASYTWTVDTVAPDTSIISNPPNPSNSSSASFNVTATETATYQCQMDGGGYSSCSSPKGYTGLSDGSHTFYVKAIDPAGNTDLTPASYTWIVSTVADTTAPTTTALPGGGTYISAQNVTLTADEEATTYWCLGSGCTPTTVGTSVSITGSTVLRYYSKDTANNSETVKEAVYTIAAPGLNYKGGDSGAGGTDSKPGVTRSDAGSDADNLDGGKARFDLLYTFTVVFADDSGETPQQVPTLYIAHKNSPTEPDDFFKYDLTCTGATWGAGKTCTAEMPLGPASVHKYYFSARKFDGTVVRLPASGYLDGPVVKTLNGWSIVSAARDVDAASLSGSAAFGRSQVYQWVSTGLDPVYNTTFSGYWQVASGIKKGKAYFINGGSGTLPELAGYGETAAATHEMTLQPGWNLIATPYNGNVKLSDVTVRKGAGANETWTQAATNNWVYNTLWNFNGIDWGGTYRSDWAGGTPDAVLAPWMGYWIYLRVNDDTYTLTIPKPAQ